MRETLGLNFDWQFKKGTLTEGGAWETVDIPHTNCILPYNNFSEYLYQFVSTYQKTVTLRELKSKERVHLCFEGVMHTATVHINGHFIKEHKGGYTPFMCDITEYVREGENVIVVETDATEDPEIPPFGHVVDFLTYGGIYREVRIEYIHQIHIENAFIKTLSVTEPIKRIQSIVQLNTPLSGNLKVRATYTKDDFKYQTEKATVKNNSVTFEDGFSSLLLWDLDHPHLYTATFELFDGKNLIDTYQTTFGVRQAKFTSDGFYLNNVRIKLRGLNRHQCYPYVGYAMPKSAQENDAYLLKHTLGLNVVRTSHYPQSKHFLNACDQLGLLVFEEIPGWQHIGDEMWKTHALHYTKSMIERDRNHPSIILWGTRINESKDDDAFYQATRDLAKTLDDTRQIGGVRNFAGSHLIEDVYTYNDFVHRGFNRALEKPLKITKTRVPYLVTEYNGHMFPTKSTDAEMHRVEHAIRHLNVLHANYRLDTLSGAIGWCMHDYNTHKDFGSGDRICYHGVLDMFRIPKTAAYVYASLQHKTPVLHVSSDLNMGEHPALSIDKVYVFTNCDYVDVYRNDTFIERHIPSPKYTEMPHAPIIIDDFIGPLIEKQEKFSKRDAFHVKRILLAYNKSGMEMPLRFKLRLKILMIKYRLTSDDLARLFTTYLGDWGQVNAQYRFEGFIDNQCVKTVIKGASYENHLQIKPDQTILHHQETYDVSRIVITLEDQFNNRLMQGNDVLTLHTTEGLEILGPKRVALLAGAIAFWVKTTGKQTKASVTISHDYYGQHKVDFTIKK